jgi:hypothetical protein
LHIANAFETVVNTPVGLLDDNLLYGLVKVLGIDEFSATHLLRYLELFWIGVDTNDP